MYWGCSYRRWRGATCTDMHCCSIEFQCRSNARRIKHIAGVETWLGSAEREAGRHWEGKNPREAFWGSVWVCLQRGILAPFTSADSPVMLWSAEASQHREDEDKSIGGRVRVTSAHGNSRCGRKGKRRINRLPQQWSRLIQNGDDYVLLAVSKKCPKITCKKTLNSSLRFHLQNLSALTLTFPEKMGCTWAVA